MSTEVVQFRVSEEDIAFLEKRGIHPNQAARERFQALVRSLRFEEGFREARAHAARRPFDPARAIRESRADH